MYKRKYCDPLFKPVKTLSETPYFNFLYIYRKRYPTYNFNRVLRDGTRAWKKLNSMDREFYRKNNLERLEKLLGENGLDMNLYNFYTKDDRRRNKVISLIRNHSHLIAKGCVDETCLDGDPILENESDLWDDVCMEVIPE